VFYQETYLNLEILNFETKSMCDVAENIPNEQFIEHELILEQIDALIYVADIEDYRILYLNKFAEKLYGDVVGQICWQTLKKTQTEPCKYCDKKQLLQNSNKKHLNRDELNLFDNKWYEIHDKIISWSGNKTARLHVAYDITKRKKDEINLKILLKQQELFSDVALRFNQQKPFANKVNEVLQDIGKFVVVDRVSLFENFAKNTSTQLVYEWCNKGVSKKINKIRPISFNRHHPLYKRILKDKTLIINDLEASEYKDNLKMFIHFNVKSVLLIPIFLHKKHLGFISFEDCRGKREWYDNEVKLLKTLGNIISTAFERKNIEEKRLRSEQKLEVADATKDRFLSIITKDLLTPFSDIKSLSSLLFDSYEQWNDEKRKLFIKSVLESANQGYKLLDNLMVWSKIQSKQIGFNPESIDIKSVIGQTIELFQGKADKKEITLTGKPDEQIFVHADYKMLNMIFYNLVNNAIKFTKNKGSVSIKTKMLKKYLEVSICDTGIGIEKEDLKKLFRIDIDQATFGSSEEKGTGLGLIICKEFVKKNGGKIWFDADSDKGSIFKFTIPLSKWHSYISK
jgi:signal transduction histidine kinase